MSAGDISLQPPADGISCLAFSPDSSRLLVASWDSSIQLHDLSSSPSPPKTFTHPAAVLAVTFGSSSQIAFSGGLDKRVRQWDFETGQCRVLGKHDDTISSIVWCADFNVLVTGSWDQTLKVWDPNAQEPLRSSHPFPSRIFNLSYAPSTQTLLISMAHRIIRVIKLPDLAASTSMDIQDGQDFSAAALQKREGALKFLTRSVAVMNDGKGWVSSSIEGRIAVEYFGDDAAIQAKKYAFRAHRQTVGGEDLVYPINAVAYHPTHSTFASGGSDGHISIWDQAAKKRMKLYAKYPTGISSLAFSPDGMRLAIGCSYEHDNAIPEADRGRVMLLIKDGVMEDCRPKAKA